MQNPNQVNKPLNALQVYMYRNKKANAAGQAVPHAGIPPVLPKAILELVALYMAMPTKLEHLLALVTFMMETRARNELNVAKDVLNNAIQTRNEASEYVNPIYEDVFGRVIQVIGNRQTFWLLRAADEGKHHAVMQLLKIPGIDVNAVDIWGMTPLILAACYGHAACVKALFKAPGFDGHTLNARNRGGKTALIWAAHSGHAAAVDVLLKAPGFDLNTLNAADREGTTALMWAASQGHASIVEALIKAPDFNADALNARGHEGCTALMLAAYYGHASIVEALIKAPGFDANTLNAMNAFGFTALRRAATQGYIDVVHLLFIKGLLVEGYASAEETMNRLSTEAGEVVVTPVSLCTHFLKQAERLPSPEEKIKFLEKALSKDNAFAAIMVSAESNEVARIQEALSKLDALSGGPAKNRKVL